MENRSMKEYKRSNYITSDHNLFIVKLERTR